WRGAGGAGLFGRVPPAPAAKLTFCLALVGARHGTVAGRASAAPIRGATGRPRPLGATRPSGLACRFFPRYSRTSPCHLLQLPLCSPLLSPSQMLLVPI